MTSGGLAAVSSSFFAALYSAFGKYDVVHIHAEGPAFFCWIPKLFGKRVISTIHGLDWDREKWRGSVASKFIRGGEKNAVKYADEIIVLSKDVQKYFLETYGRETHFIPNGVNRPEVREAKLITDHFGLEKDSYILFLGRLVPEKGIRYLVEAFKNVKTDKKLVIAGGSSDTDSFMEELKELAKGDDRILFTGFVQGAMLDELYRAIALVAVFVMEHSGKKMLFVGMGCQSDGFRKFSEMKGIRDRVYIVDIICHGSPSPKLWREYAESVQKKDGKITFLTFKDKRNGWKSPTAYVKANGEEKSIKDSFTFSKAFSPASLFTSTSEMPLLSSNSGAAFSIPQ